MECYSDAEDARGDIEETYEFQRVFCRGQH